MPKKWGVFQWSSNAGCGITGGYHKSRAKKVYKNQKAAEKYAKTHDLVVRDYYD